MSRNNCLKSLIHQKVVLYPAINYRKAFGEINNSTSRKRAV